MVDDFNREVLAIEVDLLTVLVVRPPEIDLVAHNGGRPSVTIAEHLILTGSRKLAVVANRRAVAVGLNSRRSLLHH